jgi:hypothetical protein
MHKQRFRTAPRRSGSFIRGEHPSRRGNKVLKRTLFLSAFAALRDPISRAYYARKVQQGKRHNQALISLARRRCDVRLAMLRNGTFYEPWSAPQRLTNRIGAPTDDRPPAMAELLPPRSPRGRRDNAASCPWIPSPTDRSTFAFGQPLHLAAKAASVARSRNFIVASPHLTLQINCHSPVSRTLLHQAGICVASAHEEAEVQMARRASLNASCRTPD